MKNVILLMIAILFSTTSALCQWGTEVGENVPLTEGEGLKINVLVEPGPDNGWYVSYTVLTSPNTHVLHLARVDSSGIILWDNVVHNLSDVGSLNATMISDIADGIIIAWEDRRDPENPAIYTNRIGPDGTKLWGADDVQINETEGEQGCPKLISNGQGGALVTFHDEGPGNGEFSGIYAHNVESTGSVLWETYLFPGAFDCSNYSITSDGDGGLVAVTPYFHPLDQESQLRAMRIDASGSKVWPDETIELGVSLPIGMLFQSSEMDGYGFPKLDYHPSVGIYLVYWHNPFGGDPVHRGQLIDVDGDKQWADEDVVLNEPSDVSPGVNVLVDLDGNLYFNYHTDTHWELQKVLTDGSLSWSIGGVEYSSDQTGSPDKLALTTCNDVMVLVDGVDEIIHAVRIDGSGEMVYDPPLLPLSVYDLDYLHRDPVIGVNENDRVIAVWAEDDNISEFQLFMHGFHKNGILGNPTSVQDLHPVDFKMYPNPISNGDFVVIETSEIDFGNVSIIDFSGKTIMEQVRVDFSGGATRVSLPGEMNAGIYLLQISHNNQLFSSKLVVY